MKLLTSLTVTAFTYAAFINTALAAPQASKTSPAPSVQTALKDLKLPSQAEINDMLENMPDFNGIMGDMLELAQDEKVQKRLKASAESFKSKLDESDVLTKRDANGLPDINAVMSVLLGAMTDEGFAGELLEGMTEFAEEMEIITEKHSRKAKP